MVSPLKREGQVVIPQHALVFGHIQSKRHVGLGILHERALLRLEFDSVQLPGEEKRPLASRLAAIDNAREQVTKDGTIRGILSAGGPPGFLSGLWSRPNPNMFARVPIGVVGVTHFACELWELNPIASAAAVLLRFAIVPFPEPEIRLPPGTDMTLDVADAASFGPLHSEEADSQPVPALAKPLPLQTVHASSGRPSDITNFLFIGSRAQVEQAFTQAQWQTADMLTALTMVRVYRSMSRQDGYSTEPVSTLLLNGNAPDLIFQRSMNTVAKRHHIRIWASPENVDGERVWIGAATHDIGIELHTHGRAVNHAVDPAVDGERSKVLDDLSFAGCVENVRWLERQGVSAAISDAVMTDGRMAVVRLKNCEGPGSAVIADTAVPARLNPGIRLIRRLLLEGRQSVMRGNVYYWAYKAGEQSWKRVRMRNEVKSTLAASAQRPVGDEKPED